MEECWELFLNAKIVGRGFFPAVSSRLLDYDFVYD